MQGIQPTELSEEIRRSWVRAREQYQIDPSIAEPRRVLTPDEMDTRRERDAVLRFPRPSWRISRLASTSPGTSSPISTARAGCYQIDGDARVVDRVAEIEFRPGAKSAEDLGCDGDGPGTALAEGKAIEVFASEHFVSKWQAWSCAAAPVFEPGKERPVGLVDITGPWEMQRRQAILVARAIARAVQERLRAANCVRDEVVRHAFLTLRSTCDALVAVDARGNVIGANEPARRRMRHAGRSSARREIGDRRRPPWRLAAAGRRSPHHGSQREGDPHRFTGPVRRHERRRHPSRRGGAEHDAGAAVGAVRVLSDPRPVASIQKAVELARTAARNTLPVVLYGESGTGKELFAQAIHSASDRRGERFVAVNCGSIPAQLVEAELFGYESGTFTGARREGDPRQVRGREQGYALPRRGERAAVAGADRAAARPAGARGRPPRREYPAERGRPRHRREQQAARGGDSVQAVPPRPLLSAERLLHLRAAASRARRRRPRAPRWGLPEGGGAGGATLRLTLAADALAVLTAHAGRGTFES